MEDHSELQNAYLAIFLKEYRGEIDRAERIVRIVALRETLAADLTFDQRNAIANKAAYSLAEISDEVNATPGGKWQ
jgi:hypothetical protein